MSYAASYRRLYACPTRDRGEAVSAACKRARLHRNGGLSQLAVGCRGVRFFGLFLGSVVASKCGVNPVKS
jgi:hypothetical protein